MFSKSIFPGLRIGVNPWGSSEDLRVARFSRNDLDPSKIGSKADFEVCVYVC